MNNETLLSIISDLTTDKALQDKVIAVYQDHNDKLEGFEIEMDQLKAKLADLVSSPEYVRLLEVNDRTYSDDRYPLHFMVSYRRYPHQLLEENLSSKQLLSELLNGDGEGDTIVFWDFTRDEFDIASQALENEDDNEMLKDLREGLEGHWVSSMDDDSIVEAVKDLIYVHNPAILICDRYNSLVGEAELITKKYNLA